MSQNIVYRQQNENIFLEQWDIFTSKKKSDFRYFRENIEMLILLSKERNFFSQDKSFVYLENGEVKGCAFLLIEEKDGAKSMTASQGYLPAPLFDNEKIRKNIFGHIDQMAQEERVTKILFSIDSLQHDITYNYLQVYGYIDTSILSYVVDISLQGDMYKMCRENHRRSIKKIKDNHDFSIFFVDQYAPSYALHEEYRMLHAKCSGKVTRSKESFDCQYESLKKGRGFLVGLSYKDKHIAYCSFEYAYDKAIYYSGADDPDFAGWPLYHILTYEAMEYVKKHNIRYLDMGQPASPSVQMSYSLDEKQKNICLFKTGFPGSYRQQYCGIKYFSQDSLKEDMDKLIHNYFFEI